MDVIRVSRDRLLKWRQFGVDQQVVMLAEKLAAAGMRVAALTPDKFADWIGEVIR